MNYKCKRCLLLEAGEKKSFACIKDYISSLDDDLKVSNDVYRKRLEFCRSVQYSTIKIVLIVITRDGKKGLMEWEI